MVSNSLPGWLPGEGAHIDIFSDETVTDLTPSGIISLYSKAISLALSEKDIVTDGLVLSCEVTTIGESRLQYGMQAGRLVLAEFLQMESLSCPPLLYRLLVNCDHPVRSILEMAQRIAIDWDGIDVALPFEIDAFADVSDTARGVEATLLLLWKHKAGDSGML